MYISRGVSRAHYQPLGVTFAPTQNNLGSPAICKCKWCYLDSVQNQTFMRKYCSHSHHFLLHNVYRKMERI